MVERDKLLDENLEHIGDTLHQTPRANAVRAEAALEIGTHLTFEEDIEQREHCIEQHQANSDEQTLKSDCSPFGDIVSEEGVKPCGSD